MNRANIRIVSFTLIIIGLFMICEAFSATEGEDEDAFDAQKTKEYYVGAAIKLFAKGYIAVTDIEKIKKANIDKLKKMDDKEFADKYTTIYKDMNGFPQEMKNAYGIDDKMDKFTAINKIQSADKKDLYKIIDGIPDTFIVKHFDNFMGEKGFDMNRPLSTREVIQFWNNIRKKFDTD